MLTSTKIGKLLGLSKATIIRLARDGVIPSIVLPSGHRRFDLEEVREALREDTRRFLDGLGKLAADR